MDTFPFLEGTSPFKAHQRMLSLYYCDDAGENWKVTSGAHSHQQQPRHGSPDFAPNFPFRNRFGLLTSKRQLKGSPSAQWLANPCANGPFCHGWAPGTNSTRETTSQCLGCAGSGCRVFHTCTRCSIAPVSVSPPRLHRECGPN